MKKKLIAIDLDGTTLNNQSLLTERTINTLQNIESLGHHISIVTGRPYRTSKHIYEQLQIANPLVNFNGALCHIPENPSWFDSYQVQLDMDIALDMSKYFSSLDANLMIFEGKDHYYSTSQDMPISPFFPDKTAPLLLDLNTVPHTSPIAITIFSSVEKQAQMREQLQKRYGNAIDVRTWGGSLPCLEVVSTGVQKAMGVEQVAKSFNIKQEDVIAFGDEENDQEMIKYAGHGVAMQNAIPHIKSIADDVTPFTNDQDGLALYLEDYFQDSLNSLANEETE